MTAPEAQGSRFSGNSAISDDGRYVAFDSAASKAQRARAVSRSFFRFPQEMRPALVRTYGFCMGDNRLSHLSESSAAFIRNRFRLRTAENHDDAMLTWTRADRGEKHEVKTVRGVSAPQEDQSLSV